VACYPSRAQLGTQRTGPMPEAAAEIAVMGHELDRSKGSGKKSAHGTRIPSNLCADCQSECHNFR